MSSAHSPSSTPSSDRQSTDDAFEHRARKFLTLRHWEALTANGRQPKRYESVTVQRIFGDLSDPERDENRNLITQTSEDLNKRGDFNGLWEMVWGEANPQKPNNHGTDAEKLEFDWVAHVATGTPPTYTKNDCVAIQPSTPKTTTTTKNVPDTEDLPCRYIVCDACPDRTHLKGKVMQLERGLEFLLLRERQRQGNDSLRITDVVETAGLVFEGKTTDAAVEAAKIRTFVESNQGLLKNAMELLEEGRLFCAVMPKPPEALPTKELKELGDKLDTAWGAVKTLKMEMKTVEAQLADLRANIAIIEEALRKQGLM